MKNITASVLLILFLFSIAKPNAAADQPVIVDTDGDPVRSDQFYYIATSNGLLDQDSSPNRLCPKDIIETQNTSIGQPVVFIPVINGSTAPREISEATDLNIVFIGPIDDHCPISNVWKVDNFDLSIITWWVRNGGFTGNFCSTMTSWFKIHRRPDTPFYHIRYCPSVSSCETLCASLTMTSIPEDPQTKRLCLARQGQEGWFFQFRKAPRSTSAIKQVVGDLSRFSQNDFIYAYQV